MTRLGFLGSILGIFGLSKLNAHTNNIQKSREILRFNKSEVWIRFIIVAKTPSLDDPSGAALGTNYVDKFELCDEYINTYNHSKNDYIKSYTSYSSSHGFNSLDEAKRKFIEKINICTEIYKKHFGDRLSITYQGIINEGSLDAPVWKLQAR